MLNWKKTLLLPALGAAVLFGAIAPAIASADTDTAANDRATDIATTDLRPGVVVLTEGHVLEARGVGNVTIAGRGVIEGVAYGGTLTVKSDNDDARIHVSARARRLNADGSITFIGLNGEFEIKGSALKLEFRRTGIHFEAEGNGRFDLEGTGWYRIDGGRPMSWRSQ